MTRKPALLVLAMAALLVGAACGRRTAPGVSWRVTSRIVTSGVPEFVSPNGPSRSLPMTSDQGVSLSLPPGCSVVVAGSSIMEQSMGMGAANPASAYDPQYMIDAFTKGALALAAKLAVDDQKQWPRSQPMASTGAQLPVNDGSGGIFQVEPRRAHFLFKNLQGKVQGSFPLPPDSATPASLRAVAAELVQDSEFAQDEALEPISGAPFDTTIPPPGYKVKFGGKGILTQSGPSISFGPIPEAAIAKRLVGVVQLDVIRDQADPSNKGVPEPDACFAVIQGPSGRLSFDFPCKGGWTDASRKAVEAKAALLAKQIEAVNKTVIRSSQEAAKAQPRAANIAPQQNVSTQAIHGPH